MSQLIISHHSHSLRSFSSTKLDSLHLLKWPVTITLKLNGQNFIVRRPHFCFDPCRDCAFFSACLLRIQRQQVIEANLVGGWTTHLKNIIVKLDHIPKNRDENSKNVWNYTFIQTFIMSYEASSRAKCLKPPPGHLGIWQRTCRGFIHPTFTAHLMFEKRM